MIDMPGLLSMDSNENHSGVIKRLRTGKMAQLFKFSVGPIFSCNFILISHNLLNVTEVFFYNATAFCIDQMKVT